MKFKSVVLKPGKERALTNRHPWIFSGAIKYKENLVPGEIAIIKSSDNTPLALGHFCQEEGLSCRIFTFEPNIKLDDNFWQLRFKNALALRSALGLPSSATDGYRLVHGEGDGLSGLVVDIFRDAASIQCTNPGLISLMPLFTNFLVNECKVKTIYFFDALQKRSDYLLGTDKEVDFIENNLHFYADIQGGQKTGYFLDQRINRQFVRSMAQGRTVLDAFCYSGGFSTYALAGGAQKVISVDISSDAIDLCKRNVLSNKLSQQHETVVADCFNYLRTIKKDEFDFIVLDPPAFAKSQSAIMRASRGYKDINLLALKAIKSEGILCTFSCSHHINNDLFQKILFAAAKDSGREVKIISWFSQAGDHPVSLFCPESQYLKGLALYVR